MLRAVGSAKGAQSETRLSTGTTALTGSTRNLPALLAGVEIQRNLSRADRVLEGLFLARLSNRTVHACVYAFVKQVLPHLLALAAEAPLLACLILAAGLQAAVQAAPCVFSPARLWRTLYMVRVGPMQSCLLRLMQCVRAVRSHPQRNQSMLPFWWNATTGTLWVASSTTARPSGSTRCSLSRRCVARAADEAQPA